MPTFDEVFDETAADIEALGERLPTDDILLYFLVKALENLPGGGGSGGLPAGYTMAVEVSGQTLFLKITRTATGKVYELAFPEVA